MEVPKYAEDQTPIVIARLFEGVVGIELTLCLGLGLILPDLIRWAGLTNYAAAAPMVLLLAPAQLLLQLYVFSPGFSAAKRTDLQLAVSVLGAIAAVVANYLLVGRFAGTGAAVATLGASLTFFGFWFVLSNRLYSIPIHWYRVGVITAVFIAFSVVGSSNLLPTGVLGLLIRLFLTVAMMFMVVATGLINLQKVIRVLRGSGTWLSNPP